ncbi:lipase maturation factor 1 isoform X1 [Hippopotamus amphibius kiboko]|uniref:lipase maturation factor 1 isoform X1 n=1 Tax=Hippopotamus amphibius kiboko TaxID=575201 RepID=UPI00259564EA|nr:lipase maturation factor 1 isoform X1 [Hippopotamus amphibius kiboko]
MPPPSSGCWTGLTWTPTWTPWLFLGWASPLSSWCPAAPIWSSWLLSGSSTCPWSTWGRSGWESQLLETGFLGIFLCPFWTLSPLPRRTPTSRIVLWGFRWLIFRIMLGAGLIKIRGDRCWRDLTCMDFHYETQPVPNPVAYFLHHSPWWFHRFETLSNHFLELVVPFFVFLGRRMCVLHGALQILFQVVLIISGNLSFLNWLTIVPSIACFDDATLGFLFPLGPGRLKDQVLKMQEEEARGARAPWTRGSVARRTVNLALGVLVAWLSVPVVLNLLSPRQVMNSSFNPLRIVNTYGAFGSITKERTEIILQGTASPNASAPDAKWEDYEFKCKPGDLRRQPCLISPYHHRLDWLMWFAAFQTYEHNEWIIHLAGKLLANDVQVLSLLALNPFAGRAPPRSLPRPGGTCAREKPGLPPQNLHAPTHALLHSDQHPEVWTEDLCPPWVGRPHRPCARCLRPSFVTMSPSLAWSLLLPDLGSGWGMGPQRGQAWPGCWRPQGSDSEASSLQVELG